MRRRFAYVIVWGLATVLTVGASWLGIRSMLSAAAPARTSPLSAAELRAAAPTPPPPTPPAAPPTTATSRQTGAASSPAPPASQLPRPTPTPTPTPTGWVTEPDGRGGTAYRRTFRMQGGDTTIWFSRGDVRVLSAVARTGFAVDVDRPAADYIVVEFTSSRHRSRIDAAWRSGPAYDVDEFS